MSLFPPSIKEELARGALAYRGILTNGGLCTGTDSKNKWTAVPAKAPKPLLWSFSDF